VCSHSRTPTCAGTLSLGVTIGCGHFIFNVDFLLKWGVIKKKVDVKDLVTNEFIDEINKFNPNQIAAEAKTYTPR